MRNIGVYDSWTNYGNTRGINMHTYMYTYNTRTRCTSIFFILYTRFVRKTKKTFIFLIITSSTPDRIVHTGYPQYNAGHWLTTNSHTRYYCAAIILVRLTTNLHIGSAFLARTPLARRFWRSSPVIRLSA